MRRGEDWTEETYALAERAIGYTFRDKSLLYAAFTHASCAGQGKNNERLEFLGDAVLQLTVTEKLYLEGDRSEGELTNLRQRYVSQAALEHAEKKAGLMRFLRYAGGESNIAGKTPSSLFEAVLGAIYLDGGYKAAQTFSEKFLTLIEETNFKTILQEYVQERQKSTPHYETTEDGGAFRCKVKALGACAEGHGESKKAAETAAAKALYEHLTKRGKQ